MTKTIPNTIRASKSKDRQIPADIAIKASWEVQAADAKTPTEPAKFSLLANTGTPMQLEGFFDPVIIDISGATFDQRTTPVIADHDTTKRIGHTTEQAIIPAGGVAEVGGKQVKGPAIAAIGQQSSGMGIAQGFVDDARKGFPFQVSVGARIVPGEAYFVAEGDKVEVNGKTWKGPLIVARKTVIREMSITVLGADNKTTAKVAAQARKPQERNVSMDFEPYVRSLHLDPETLTADQRTALEAQWKKTQTVPAPANAGQGGGTPPVNPPADPPGNNADPDGMIAHRRRIAAEQSRIDGINAVADRFKSSIKADAKVNFGGQELTLAAAKTKAIEDGAEADALELACRRAERPQGHGPGIHVPDRNVQAEALEASVLRYYGTPEEEVNAKTGRKFGLRCMFKDSVLEASHERQYNFGGSIQALLDVQIRAAGQYFPGTSRKGSDFVAAAVDAYNVIQGSGFSGLNVINVLENVMHKSSLAAFEAVEGVWRFICGRKPLNDFRPHNLYRLDYDGHFRQVAVDGELKHISLTDTKKSLSADTYGAMIAIDRKTIRNDDLGLIVDQARGLGTLGGQRIEESAMVLLLTNPGSFFASGNKNLISGADSELNNLVEGKGLDLARQTFRSHVINGKPVGVSPQILLTGTTRETTANRLWKQETIAENAGDNFVNNPHKGLYRPYASPYLNNTDITDQDGAALSGQSDTQWFLFASPNAPQGACIVIGFMDGRETPYFDEAETQFNIPGGIQMRSYLDWGVALHMEQMGLKSAGA